MTNAVMVIIDNNLEELSLTDDSRLIPIKYDGVPIGFVDSVKDDKILCWLWPHKWGVEKDQNDKVISLDLCATAKDDDIQLPPGFILS